MKLILRSILSVCFTLFTSTLAFAQTANFPGFASAEHIIAGDDVRIFFQANDPGKRHFTFHLPNGLEVSYGELVAFGDLYGTPGQPISQAKTQDERNALFLAAFNSFAVNEQSVKEAKELLEILHFEQTELNEGMKKGQPSEKIYQKIHSEIGRRLNCVTGGGCTSNAWWLIPGRYLKLASMDYDHFADNAWIAYKTGHDLALREAVAAGKTQDLKRLEYAYALNGFASHYLSDRFSSGHMRTPRKALPENVTPNTLGSLLGHYMHDEENAFGLHVHNELGDQWVAFGDYSYLNPQNAQNLYLLNIALQTSALQIFFAYQRGIGPVDPSEDIVHSYLPFPNEVNNGANQDISPMFYWDEASKKIMRRQNLADPHDRHWTASWWGWSTLAILIENHGELPALAQAQLASSEYADQALKEGVITDKNLIDLIKRKNKTAT